MSCQSAQARCELCRRSDGDDCKFSFLLTCFLKEIMSFDIVNVVVLADLLGVRDKRVVVLGHSLAMILCNVGCRLSDVMLVAETARREQEGSWPARAGRRRKCCKCVAREFAVGKYIMFAHLFIPAALGGLACCL